jgi:glyoxylase-like metal-dependent hydrolase (beta-lactamase superfamily II)
LPPQLVCENRPTRPGLRAVAVDPPDRTPGHSPQDISTVVDSDDGLAVFRHLWWTSSIPEEDPFAPDPAVLHENRARVLGLAGLRLIVPGHGAPFEPGADTPR